MLADLLHWHTRTVDPIIFSWNPGIEDYRMYTRTPGGCRHEATMEIMDTVMAYAHHKGGFSW